MLRPIRMGGRGRGSNPGWDWESVRVTCVRLARRYGEAADAEDIAQEALIRAWRFRGTLREGERLQGWLATIVRNEAVRAHARRRPEPVAEPELGPGAEDQRLLALATAGEVAGAMDALDGPERLLIELRYARDLTQPAIARALEMPEGTVKVRLHRARAKLRRALSDV
jgi:RNA polymerase sigma-70 factor, ECF subfamily